MTTGLAAFVDYEVLLGNVRLVGCFVVFREEMVERLILARSFIRRDRLIPLLGVVERWVNVEDHAAKREETMSHNLTDCEFRLLPAGYHYMVGHEPK